MRTHTFHVASARETWREPYGLSTFRSRTRKRPAAGGWCVLWSRVSGKNLRRPDAGDGLFRNHHGFHPVQGRHIVHEV